MTRLTQHTSAPGYSLSFLVAFWNALVISAVMGCYAVFQHYQMPEMPMEELFLHHTWHVIVLGGVIHLSCWLVFRFLLFQPLKQIYLHLYRLGSGDVQELKVKSSVREIAAIIEGVNVMIWRLEHWLDADSLEKTREELEQIGLIAAQLRMENHDVSEAITKRVESLEESLLAIVAAKGNANGRGLDMPTVEG